MNQELCIVECKFSNALTVPVIESHASLGLIKMDLLGICCALSSFFNRKSHKESKHKDHWDSFVVLCKKICDLRGSKKQFWLPGNNWGDTSVLVVEDTPNR